MASHSTGDVQDPELALSLRAALERLEAPASLAALRRALPKSFQRPPAVLRRVLDRLVAQGRVFVLASGKTQRYSASDPRALARSAVLEALREGPVTKRAIAALVKRRAPGVQPGGVLGELVADGTIYEHRKPGKDGLPTKQIERYGLVPQAPPPADAFLRATRRELAKAVDKARGYGVSAEALVAALSVERGSNAAAGACAPSDERQVLSGLRRLCAREPSGALIPVRKLRGELGLDKSRFDRAVLSLSRGRNVILHHHDFPERLSESERAGLVIDEQGTHYVGIALGTPA